MANEIIEVEADEKGEVSLSSLMTPTALDTHGEIEARRVAVEGLAKLQMAKSYPRKPQMKEVEDELKETCKDPQFAEKAIYAKPVDNTGKNFIYGPSIFLAEEIARVYPNFDVETTNHGPRGSQTQGEVKIWDMERNNPQRKKVSVSHMKWNGKTQTPYEEKNPSKLRDLYNAEESRVKRNLIFATTPKLLQRKCYEWCEATNKAAAESLISEGKAALKTYLEQFEVPENVLLEFIGKKKLEDLTTVDIRLLRAIYAAIKSGEVKASNLFEGAKDPKVPTRGDAEKAPPAEAENKDGGKQEKSGSSTRKTSKDTAANTTTETTESGKSSSQSSDPTPSSTSQSETTSEKSTTASSEESEKSSKSESTSSSKSEASSESGAESKKESAKPPAEKPKVSAEDQADLEAMFK